MKNRTKIRLCSYGAAVLAVAAGLAVTGWRAASHWRTRLENHYQQAWAELSEYLAEMESTLNKLLYTNSLPEQTVLSAELLRDAGGAQHALSVLPSDAEPMADVYRYLAQAGEYAQSLAARRAAGEAPDEASAASLAALYDYAASLNDALLDYRRQTTPVFTHESLALEGAAPPSVTDGFRSAADELEAYPTLLYDGAFADRVEQVGAGPVKDGHEVVADGLDAELGQVADALLVVLDVLIAGGQTDLDVIVDIDGLNYGGAEAGRVDLVYDLLDLGLLPDLAGHLAVQRPDDLLNTGNLLDVAQGDGVIALTIPAPTHFHRHVVLLLFV